MRWRCLGPKVWFGLGLMAVSTSPVWAVGDAPLREGVARFHYYQQDYLPALSELMVARQRGQINEAGSNAVLEGAIRLAFGMPDSAEQQLEHSLNERPAQQDAARYYLGKLHYMQGDWRQASAVWSRVGEALEPELKREQQALQWQLAIREGQFDTPSRARLWRDLQDWTPLVLYNLGGERARAGAHDQARYYYQGVTQRPPRSMRSDPEYLALKDRAHTAAGFSWLLEGELEQAEAEFSRVRLDRPEANRALLGYGWAAAERGDYREALRPWQALSERLLTDASVQEAQLALPHAYEQLKAPAAAMEAYDRAEQRLQAELDQVQALSQNLSGPQLLESLSGGTAEAPLSARVRQNWLSLTRTTVAFTDNDYLEEWVNQSQFQAQVQALSDLLDQRALLSGWRPKLNHYGELLEQKRDLRQARQNQLERDQILAETDTLHLRRAALAERLAQIEQQRDYLALADAETQSLEAMAEAAQGRLARLRAAGEDVTDRAKRLRFYQGILRWQAAEAFPDNLWQAQKQASAADEALQTLNERRQRVDAIVADNPDIQPALARMANLDRQIQQHITALDQSLETRAQALALELQDHLADHQQRLNHYLARVRLAAARLQDEALHSEGAQGAEPFPETGATL